MDMLMLTTNNSRLRSFEEWQQLFLAADAGFGKGTCWTTRDAPLAILEFVWEGP
jgi:hypothetical protein